MRRVAVPVFAAGLSAWGMLHTDLRYEMARSELGAGGVPEDDALRTIWAGLESEGRARVNGYVMELELAAERFARHLEPLCPGERKAA